MATIRDRRIRIDPHFPTPPGVLNVNQEETGDTRSDADEAEVLVDPVIVDEVATAQAAVAPTSTRLATFAAVPEAESVTPLPTTYTVSSQTVRMTSDGRSAVDVVLEFPDHEDLGGVEVRYSKE